MLNIPWTKIEITTGQIGKFQSVVKVSSVHVTDGPAYRDGS